MRTSIPNDLTPYHYLRIFRYIVLAEYFNEAYSREEVLHWNLKYLESKIDELEQKFRG